MKKEDLTYLQGMEGDTAYVNGLIIGKIDKFKSKKSTRIALYILIGLIVGFVNGLWGGGGGIFIVPLLVYLMKYEERQAHATAIVVILPLCVISTIVYILQGYYNWELSLEVGSGVIVGGLLGTFLLKKLSNNVLAIVFYGLMIAAGIRIIIG